MVAQVLHWICLTLVVSTSMAIEVTPKDEITGNETRGGKGNEVN